MLDDGVVFTGLRWLVWGENFSVDLSVEEAMRQCFILRNLIPEKSFIG
jgi:hypothetical protein